MRLFVVLFPDKQLREYFRDFKQSLSKYKRNFKFIGMDQLHLTIKFLGDNVNEEIYGYYLENLRNYTEQIKKFEYELVKPRFGIKGQNLPRTLFAYVKPNDTLDEITKIATEATKGLGEYNIAITKERKKLIHHFTLARVKSHMSRTFALQFDEVLEKINPPDFKVSADSLAIVSSTVTPNGPIYKTIDTIDLK